MNRIRDEKIFILIFIFVVLAAVFGLWLSSKIPPSNKHCLKWGEPSVASATANNQNCLEWSTR